MAKYTVRECKRMLDNLGNQASQLMVRYAVRECLASPWWPGLAVASVQAAVLFTSLLLLQSRHLYPIYLLAVATVQAAVLFTSLLLLQSRHLYPIYLRAVATAQAAILFTSLQLLQSRHLY